MLRKIKNVIINVFCFLWITMVCLIAAMPKDGGGTGINGFLAFGLWILCIFIMTKIRPWIVALVSTLIVVGIQIANSEITWAGFIKEIEMPIGTLVMVLILGKLFLGEIKAWETESDARNERKRNAQKRGEACCPRCGSVSIQYYSLGIPYEEYGEIKHLSNKYHCNNCGSEW